MKTKDKIEAYKTMCCNAGWYRKGRADFRCKRCGEDVTFEIFLLFDL